MTSVSNGGTTTLGLYDTQSQLKEKADITYVDSVAEFIALPFKSGISYDVNQRVQLANGDIVKSTVPNNTANPNTDMTGWVKTNAASQIIDVSGKTQQEINDSANLLGKALRDASIVDPSSVDTTAVFNSIAAAETPRLSIPKNIYKVSGDIVFNSDIELNIEDGTVFDLGSSGSISFSGSELLLGGLTANASKHSDNIKVSSVSDIQADDLICIYNNNEYSFSPHRPYYKAGEFLKVRSIDAATGTIYFYGLLADNYPVDINVSIYKINTIRATWNNLKVITDNTNAKTPVTINYGEGFEVGSFENKGGMHLGIRLSRCYNVTVGNIQPTNSSDFYQLNYGLQLSNCQDCKVNGGVYNSTRHGVAIGGGDDVCSIPNRRLTINDAVLQAFTGSTSGADIHGNSEFCTYNRCTMNYTSIGGGNQTIRECNIYSRKDDGLCIYANEINKGFFDFIDNNYYVNGPTDTWAMIHFAPKLDLIGDIQINIINGKMYGVGGALSKAVMFAPVAAAPTISYYVNINIDGLKSYISDLSMFLYFRHATIPSLLMPSRHLIVDNVYNPSPCYLIYPTVAANAVPTKQMKQQGSVQMTVATSSLATRTDPVTLKYTYSKTPVVFTALSPAAGTTWSGTTFNSDATDNPLRIPSMVNAAVNESTVRPMILWSKKPVTADQVVLNWSCEINEI